MKVENLSSKASDFTGNVWKFEGKGETVLIDAGTGDSWEEIKKLENVDKVVVTHSHYDHVDNLPKIEDRYDPEILAYEPENLPVEASELEEGDEINLSGLIFEVLHTPGHRDDSICLYNREKGLLFTGDLLFPEGGFGRTDLKEGDRDLLIESIRKLKDLDVEEMYCGHDPAARKDEKKQIFRSLSEAEKRKSKY